MARMTKTERIAREGLMKNMIHLHRDGWISSTIAEEIPDAWHTLEADLDVAEKKEKVSLYLDRSVVKFYRAMGVGYQARINRLLATWAQMKIAQEVKLDDYLEKRIAALNAGRDTNGEAEAAAPERPGPAEEEVADDEAPPARETESTIPEEERRIYRQWMAEARQEQAAKKARQAAEEAERKARRSVWREIGELEEREKAERARARGYEDDP